MKSSPLREALFNGNLFVDYGAIISVFTGKPVKNVVHWLIRHLGARLPVGVNVHDVTFLFIGPVGTPAIKLTQGVYPPAVTHLPIRASSQELFTTLSKWLETAGFKLASSATGEGEKERWYGIYTNDKLGFSIHLAWRKNPPQDPAVTQGGAPLAPSSLVDGEDDEEGESSLLQRIAASQDE